MNEFDSTGKPITFLRSARLSLRALINSDAFGEYPTWFNDAQVCQRNEHHVYPYSAEAAVSFIKSVRDQKENLVLAIELSNSHRHIGNIGLHDINYTNRCATLAIVLGDRAAWGQGFGKEVSRLLCNHAFLSMNLNRVECATFHNNTAMRKIALYLGMVEEGRKRNAVFKEGRYLDIIQYGVLRSEYRFFSYLPSLR